MGLVWLAELGCRNRAKQKWPSVELRSDGVLGEIGQKKLSSAPTPGGAIGAQGNYFAISRKKICQAVGFFTKGREGNKGGECVVKDQRRGAKHAEETLRAMILTTDRQAWRFL